MEGQRVAILFGGKFSFVCDLKDGRFHSQHALAWDSCQLEIFSINSLDKVFLQKHLARHPYLSIVRGGRRKFSYSDHPTAGSFVVMKKPQVGQIVGSSELLILKFNNSKIRT
uniref:Uncharacterized protein n=2 Tax=Strombidium inclinatum TaxID=197538 RepID=A0A7S3IT27_9SPIT|mmetsp:Transcript_34869/g.53538  ORF Transcript_34869/g.53538 Transcript_34869/m.53538 type:complete len:112 (+) Transcript_34869:175-510(+)